ncbi:MAG: endo-1,4-beta-xylanase [Clostridiales bacterium]
MKKKVFKKLYIILTICLTTALLFTIYSVSLNAALADGKTKFLGNVMGSSVPSNFGEYWNQVTPENATKWGSVESNRDSMSWSNADSIYNYSQDNNIPFKFHTLVWGSQEPNWISSLSSNEQLAEVEEWIQAAGQKYGNCEMIDVVNEPLHAPPSYKNAIGGDGSTGWDWVIWSFEYARKHFNGKLILNDYGIVNDSNACTNYLKIINLLMDRNLIDGIGVQSHTFNVENYDAATLNSNLDRLAATGLPIYVSELDLSGNDETQLNHYMEKFPVFWKHPGVKGITLWGYIQGQIWKETAYLVSSSNVGATERPAMTWLKEYLGVSPTSQNTATISQTPSVTSSPSNEDYSIEYTIQSDWNGGATISMKITNNTSSDKNNWSVNWNFTGNQQITNLWNASYTQSGTSVSVTNSEWNSTITAGGSVNFGFNISYNGTNSVPDNITIN